MLGLVIEEKRTRYIESASKKQNIEYSSLQLQYSFIDALGKEENCEAVAKTLEENIKSLESTRERLETFDKHSTINKEDFNLLKREYVLAQIRYWLLVRRAKKLCKREIATILYFYSDDKECPDCEKQAFILTYLKKLFKERLLIFSFDSKQKDEPMISILKKTYNISIYPTLVIEEKSFSGLQTKNEILKEICKYYTKFKYCEGYKQHK